MATTISININLDALRGELQCSLQRVIYLVGAGLQTKDHINSKQLYIPTDGMKMIYANSIIWDDQVAKNEYTQWVLSNGFRDAIESLSLFLESAHKVLSFWEFSEKQNDGIQITGADWNDTIIKTPQKFHRLGFPDKLEHIQKKHSIIFDESMGSHVLSINKARNCFVHRSGIVSQRDLTNENTLEISYRRMAMLLQNEDGVKDLVIGQVVEKDSVIAVRNQDETIAFNLGSKIELKPKEFTDIIWCLFLFGNSLVQKMSAYGLQNGLISENEVKSAQPERAVDSQ